MKDLNVKPKKSISAYIMHIMIGIASVLSILSFYMYYIVGSKSEGLLWVGIISVLIVYQFSLRLIFGTVNSHLPISYRQRLFKELGFEKSIYKRVHVKKWKHKVPTYNPELFVLEDFTMEEIASTMAKVEADHWANVLISFSTLLFIFIWGRAWFFVPVVIFAVLFDLVFISIQRFNRPRVLKIIEKEESRRNYE